MFFSTGCSSSLHARKSLVGTDFMAFAGFCSIAAKLFTGSGAKPTGKTCVEKVYCSCSKNTHVGGDPVALLVFSFACFSVGEMPR